MVIEVDLVRQRERECCISVCVRGEWAHAAALGQRAEDLYNAPIVNTDGIESIEMNTP